MTSGGRPLSPTPDPFSPDDIPSGELWSEASAVGLWTVREDPVGRVWMVEGPEGELAPLAFAFTPQAAGHIVGLHNVWVASQVAPPAVG